MKNRIVTALIASVLTMASAVVVAASVNLNTADAQALADNLNGIGMAKAEAIVAYRTMHGEFKTIDEVQNVKGVGAATFEMIKQDLDLKDKQP